MGKADLHIHTTYSDGIGTVSAVMEAARRTDLDVLAITDHDQVRGALEAQQMASRFGVQVIPGVEITTAEGHLLGLFVERDVPAGRPLIETILRVGDMGGICIAPHPMAQWVPSLGEASILKALAHPGTRGILVAIEVYNNGLPYLRNNQRAQALGALVPLAQVANSDSHLLWTIGLCATEFPGSTPAQLRQALAERQTRLLVGRRSPRYYASFAKSFLLREAGLAYWTSEPGKRAVLRRLATVQA